MLDTQSTKRLTWLLWGLLAWSALLVGRLFMLQVVKHDDYKKLANQQQRRQVEVEARRGAILDFSGQALAKSLPVDSVCVNPLRVPALDVAVDLLAPILQLDRVKLLERLSAAKAAGSGFLWVKRRISPEESARLRSMKLDWIEFRTESRRFYPLGQLASHVLGGMGILNQNDTVERGNAGLEMALNDELAGAPGRLEVYTDVRQNPYDAVVARPSEPGADVILTIDSRIQHVAEHELAAAAERSHATSGSVVVMQPRTGEILAVANYPTYDPNRPPSPDDPPLARSNLAVTTPFEPGSVFKVITLSAALETTPLRPETIIPCGNGLINLFGRVIHDHDPYSALSMADVLAKSSNIGAIQVGLKVGDQRMYEYVRRFGFGQATRVGMPGESTGLVRKLSNWGKSSIGSVAMGHEISTTAMQLAQACSVIANGGLLVKPRIVRGIRRVGTDQLMRPAEEPPKKVLAPETAHTMRQLMEGVVLHGTGKRAILKGYTSGGKTGSAQIFDTVTRQYTHRYNGSFMGFAPVTRPAIVVVVSLNGTTGGSAGFGGVVAAPVFREVAAAALRILDVPKDLPDDAPILSKGPELVNDLAVAGLSPAVNPLVDSDESNPSVSSVTPPPAVVVSSETTADRRPFLNTSVRGTQAPNFRGKTLRGVLEESAALGLSVEVSGSGLARAQYPEPGATLMPGQRVRVQFAR
jgi:cell division protein FtsI (penicillin-binding protein 3)